jgi:outer membrane protein OmpA-like peptidoglycan-associated protein
MPIYKIIIFFFLFQPVILIGQNSYIVYKDLSKKEQKKFDRAEKFAKDQEYESAHRILNRLKETTPVFVDAYLKNGAIYFEQKDTASAISELEQALKIAPDYRINTHRFLATLCYDQGDFGKAVLHQSNYVKALKDQTEKAEGAIFELKCYKFAEWAIKNPVNFKPVAMSDAINTDSSAEYLPSFTADELKMIFTRRTGNLENLYESTRQNQNESWSPSILSPIFNTAANEGAFNMSADGNTIIFTRCGPNPALENYNSCDLFESEFVNGIWSNPESLEAINSYAWESQPCISENGQTLVFSSNRGGGYGKNDIYVSYKDELGSWSDPVNMGSVINTKGNEASPFFHEDGTSLYFMSDGHVGMGSYDLFLSRKKENSWLAPMNLGYPINTNKQEGALVVSLDGRTAYFAIDDERADIVSFELYEAIRPNPVSYVKGIVKDKSSNKPIAAKIEVARTDGSQKFSLKTDQSGEFLITLATNNSYSFTVEKENYLFFSERFEFVKETGIVEPIYLEIQLDSIGRNIAEQESDEVILKNVFFPTGSSELLESSFGELSKLLSLLEEHPQIKIEIQGHTDNIGSEEDNIKLSEARAKAVYAYLQTNGIGGDRLRYKGYGEERPVADNDIEKGRAQNRRTSFIILKE